MIILAGRAVSDTNRRGVAQQRAVRRAPSWRRARARPSWRRSAALCAASPAPRPGNIYITSLKTLFIVLMSDHYNNYMLFRKYEPRLHERKKK